MIERKSGEWKRLAREFLTGSYPVFAASLFTAYFLPAAALMPFSIGLTDEPDAAWVIYLFAALILKVLGKLLSAGVNRMHLLLAKRQPAAFKDLFWAFRSSPDKFILGTLLLYGLCLIPVIPAAAGIGYYIYAESAYRFALMIVLSAAAVCAVLYFRYSFGMIYLLYIENPDMTVLEGFCSSRKLMRGSKWKLFVLHISFTGWQLLGLCSAGIGLLWIGPYIRQTTINFYLDLTGCLDRKGEHIDVGVC